MLFVKWTTLEIIKWVICGLLILSAMICIFLLLINHLKKKHPTFAEIMNEKKSIRLSFVIDMNQKTVETYYVYETNNKSKIVNYDEFTYSFDSENLKKLTDWLAFIHDNSEYGNYRRIELQMYDEAGNKRLYRCSLQNYIKENNKYFIIAQDITVSSQMIKDYEKKLALYDTESFYENTQRLLKLTLDNEYACIASFKYKEYESIVKDFKDDFIKLIDYEILNRLEAIMEEDMAICQSKEATFHLFFAKVVSFAKVKQKLKKVLQTCSGNLVVGKGNFNITFFAGAMIVGKEDLLDCLEKSEIALNQCLKRRFFADKIRFFDKELSIIEKDKVELLSNVKKVIEEGKFDLTFHPMIDVQTKQIEGYQVEYFINKDLDLTTEKFLMLAQEIGERKKFFIQILDRILAYSSQKIIYLVVHHNQLSRFCEAYASNEKYKKIDLRLMISFENLDVTETTLVTLEKIIKGNIENNHIQFGIAITNFQNIYLNEIIYNKLKFMMIFEKVLDTSFDSTHYRISLQTSEQIANQYHLTIIGVDINNLYQYEKMFDMNAKFLTGPLFNGKIQENQIIDQNFIKQLKEVENKIER